MTKSQTEAGGASSTAPAWATLVATFFGAGRLRPGSGHLGIAGDRAAMVAAGLASSAGGANSRYSAVDRRRRGDRNSGSNPGSARLRQERSFACRDRRSCRATGHVDCVSHRVASAACGLYTFPCIRHSEAAADSQPGKIAGRHRHRGRRSGRGRLRLNRFASCCCISDVLR